MHLEFVKGKLFNQSTLTTTTHPQQQFVFGNFESRIIQAGQHLKPHISEKK
jgi:hypothetical protein